MSLAAQEIFNLLPNMNVESLSKSLAGGGGSASPAPLRHSVWHRQERVVVGPNALSLRPRMSCILAGRCPRCKRVLVVMRVSGGLRIVLFSNPVCPWLGAAGTCAAEVPE